MVEITDSISSFIYYDSIIFTERLDINCKESEMSDERSEMSAMSDEEMSDSRIGSRVKLHR